MGSKNNTNTQLVVILLGILLGALIGGLFPEAGKSLKVIGDLFLRALLGIVLPLLMSSMIVGVTALGDLRKLKGIAGWTFIYFISTMCVAATLGATLTLLIHPGHPGGLVGSAPSPELLSKMNDTSAGGIFYGILNQLVPGNIFKALAEGDFLPIIIFSLVFGAVLTMIGEKARSVIAFFQGVNEAMMLIVRGLMWTAPVGIGAMVAGRLGLVGGFSGFGQELAQLGLYVATVLSGLLIHGCLFLPLLLWWFRGRTTNILEYVKGMGPALATAFSTASSSATMPVTLQCLVRNNHISEKIANFVLPLGTTISMNGTALYEAVAALFIAQQFDITLGPAQIVIVVLTAVLASFGAPAIPEAGLVTMVIVLKSVGLPLEGISLLLMVDWFLDRCRTTVNVWDDAVGSGIVEKLAGEGPPASPARPKRTVAATTSGA